MANEIFKEIKTRIALKQNTYSYWSDTTGGEPAEKKAGAGEKAYYVPLYGEVCFCEITTTNGNNQTTTTPPTVLFKVGNGADYFKDLNWASALAADVYGWAKAPTKPVYGAKEIAGIDKYIAEYVSEDLGITVDTNTVYQIVNVSNTEYKLQSKAAGTDAWTDVECAHIIIPNPDLSNYKEKQDAYAAEGSTVKTVTKVEQDANGEVTVTYGDIAFPDATVVEDSDKNGYIKVDGEEVQVFDEVFGVDMATVNALGGIAAGTNLKDKTLHQVLNALLFPYVAPVVAQPSRVPNTTTALEKGNNQTVTSVTAKVTKKSEPIVKVELIKGDNEVIATKEGNELPNITTSGTNVTFSGLSVSIPSSSVTFKVRATDATGKSITSSASAGWTFVYPYFYGICAGDKTASTLTEADIEAMTKDIKGRGEKSYKYENMNNQKMVIAYPKAHGVLKKALDPNNFDYIDAYDRAELNITGLDGSTQAYYVYAQKDPTYGTTTMKYQY